MGSCSEACAFISLVRIDRLRACMASNYAASIHAVLSAREISMIANAATTKRRSECVSRTEAKMR
jgi:hypothetical protein